MTKDHKPWTREEFEKKLRSKEKYYHINHDFHILMNEGGLDKDAVQGWVANRFYYQTTIPIKDAAIMSNQEKTQLNRELEQLNSEAQLKQKALQEDTRRRQQEERNELLGQVQQAINAVAQDEGYDLVLESNAVAFMKADNDLSDEVVTQMSSGN